MAIRAPRKFILSCTIGTFMEFFDYTLYGYFAGTIGHLFFPTEKHSLQLIATWGIFSISFLIRPLGAMLFGHWADRMGRIKILPFTIILMAIPTACIGLLPTFAMVGWLAPLLLILCRLTQGLAMSAEYNGASIYILENHWSRPGFLGSLTPFSGGIGMLAASLLAYFFTYNLQGALNPWLWRLAFIIAGGLIGFIGWYLRRDIQETYRFQCLKDAQEVLHSPLKEVMKDKKLPLLTNIFSSALMGSASYLLLVYLATFLHEQFHLTPTDALLITSLAVLVESIAVLFFGWLSDYLGRWQIIFTASSLMAVTAILFIMTPHLDMKTLIAYLMVFSVILGAFDGPLTLFLPELFKTKTRYSSTTIGYNIGAAAIGGLAPFIVSIALNIVQEPQLILGAYLCLFAIMASVIIGLYVINRNSHLNAEQVEAY